MGYVALMPKGNILESRLDVPADDSSQAADLLTGDRIPLVGHGGTAFLAARKILLGLADFSALQVADFEGDLFAERCDQRECRNESGVAVALDHLRGDGGGTQIQILTDQLLD